MKFIWEHRDSLEKPFGSKVIGLKRASKRPDKLELTFDDWYRFNEMKDDKLKLRYIRNLFLSLAYKEDNNAP